MCNADVKAKSQFLTLIMWLDSFEQVTTLDRKWFSNDYKLYLNDIKSLFNIRVGDN